MKLATQILDFKGFVKTIPEMLDVFQETPFKYFDFPMYLDFSGDGWRKIIDDSANVASKHGFSFIQAHGADYNPFSRSHDQEAEVKQIGAMLEACSILGIKNVVLHPARPDGFESLYPDGREEYFEYNKRFYSLLFPMMEKYGVNVLTENSCEANSKGRYFFMTGEDMRDFLEYVGHPMLKAVWDTGHANIRKNKQNEDMVTLGSHLAALHVHDNDGNKDEHTHPFAGTMNFDMLMRGIIDSGYNGYFTFEASNSMIYGKSWPYSRATFESVDARLFSPSLELKLMSENLLYETGKYILSAYGMYEE